MSPILQGISESDSPKVIGLINRLLAVNFLVKELDREGYLLLRRYREQVAQFFRTLGWEFILDDRHECVFVTSPLALHQENLTKEESIWFLMLALIYQEKRQGLSLSEYPLTTTYELRTKYETFRLPFLTKTKLGELVRRCKQYHLLEPLDADVRADECRFRLFHTFLYVLELGRLEQIQEQIARYAQAGSLGEEESQDEVVETAALN